ncbi:hypothetical protein GHH_c17250 [Geobacillus sp. GHH01]|uniref:hypothetical protein n=1 Tax=Geobacillus sp. GHH01 TaxID=1233873 RepID=UPI0002AF32B8|nr:hypothetical protein [Geobacillus sp. GHH01]AGE22252.1 hypothetical protein GHH_c17250 [Geobacillus sp. GHH01]
MNRDKDKKETKKKEEQTQQTSNEDNVIRELEEEFNADIRKGQFAVNYHFISAQNTHFFAHSFRKPSPLF